MTSLWVYTEGTFGAIQWYQRGVALGIVVFDWLRGISLHFHAAVNLCLLSTGIKAKTHQGDIVIMKLRQCSVVVMIYNMGGKLQAPRITVSIRFPDMMALVSLANQNLSDQGMLGEQAAPINDLVWLGLFSIGWFGIFAVTVVPSSNLDLNWNFANKLNSIRFGWKDSCAVTVPVRTTVCWPPQHTWVTWPKTPCTLWGTLWLSSCSTCRPSLPFALSPNV